MLPIEALMDEHRIIERMIPPFKRELARMQMAQDVNAKFIETAVDFIRTFADHCHHGKEEGILFRELRKKTLSAQHAAAMNQLMEDHAHSRRTTNNLAIANASFANGNAESWRDVWQSLNDLVELFPQHIEKEDFNFFYPVMEYFASHELDAMLAEFWEFDKKLIRVKYETVVGELEKATANE